MYKFPNELIISEQRLMWCLAEGRLRYFIELLCLIRFSREPSILRQSPGCLHHAMLSPGIFKTPTGVHALVLCSHGFWLNVNIFAVSVPAGSWSCQWHNKICSEHHQYRNKQRYWQPCILFAHKNRSLSHITIFKLSVLFIFFLTDFQDGFCRKRRDNFRWKFPWRISSQGENVGFFFFECLS